MGLYATINLKRDWGFPNSTPQLGIPIDYTEAITVFSETFMKVSQEMVPVDTGYLRSSLRSSGNGMTIEAEATADYAQYVEYGTWCCPAQPYFNPAIESAADASFKVAKKIYYAAIIDEAQLVKQQYIAEAKSKIASIGQTMGNGLLGWLFPLFVMMIVQGIITLFYEFFSDIFYDNEE